MKELFKSLKKMATSFLAMCLIVSMLPIQVFAETTATDENITVEVSVENNTFLEDQGDGEPAFTGELFNTKVEVPEGSTAFDALEAALKKENIEYSGDSSYISGINGLNEFDGGFGSGWMVTVNDWFINVGVGSQTVEDNDKVSFMYSCNMGEDLGGTWSNNDKTIKALKTDVGTLSPEFSSDVKKYELKVPAGTTGVVITPTATNKNFQVRASVDGVEYKRIQTIPVKDKTVISVKCGDPSWPSMNGGDYGSADSVPAETYEITVVEEKEEATEPVDPEEPTEEGNEGETIDTVPDDFANDLWLQYDFKELKSGDTATIYPRRVPQIVDNPINNNVTRPEFNFEIIKGDSITLDTTKTTDKATVTAVKEGTSIVKVTYDAVGNNGASSIVNTAYVVYDVVGDTDTGITIDSNITLTSYDTIYYTEGKSTDYTINPTVEGADEVTVTCNGKSIEKTDDGYVLPLENRSNIIGIIASNEKGTKKYYKVIDARKIEISIVNASREGKPLRAGDTAKISFKGITHPVYKLATIYNPTWLQESWGNKGTFVEYTNETLGTVKGYCTQWDLATKNTITVKFDKEGSYKFTSGRIFTQWWGSELGADKGEEGSGDPNLSAPQNERYFSSMPDFTIDVKESLVQEGNEGETIDTLPDDFANDLWLQYDFKELKSGDTATIYPRRVPQIVDNPINNNVTRPEFNFEIIKGDSITLDTTKTTDKATVTAVKEGTSIVKVTYDAVGTNGASSIVNTAYVVYDVVGDTDTGITIDSNIKLTSYDTIYYTDGKSTNYTINPTVEGADEVAVTCNGKVIQKTDDGYVLPLENRSNIIGIIAANDKGVKKYYKVIDARKIEISIVNASREGEELQAGDTAKISFKGITHPVYKLATIYNPTWLDTSWGNKGSFVEYTNETLGTVKGYCKQWDLATNNTITVKFDQEGSYKFTSGRIFTQWWGSELGADKGEEGKGDPNLSAPQNEGYFSSMPDFTIEVKEKEQTVTFDADNGTDNIVKSVKKGEALDFVPEAPTKEGYTFVGWYTNTDDITTEYKNNATYAEDVTYKAKWAHVEMLGAQGKLVVDGKSGIRFGTKIYNDGDEIVEKGTLIIPASLLEEGEALTLDNKKAAKSIGKVNYEVNKDENYVTYLGTLINIPETQFDTEITAASYVIYKDKAGNEYKVYSQYPNGSTSVYKLLGNDVDWDNEW